MFALQPTRPYPPRFRDNLIETPVEGEAAYFLDDILQSVTPISKVGSWTSYMHDVQHGKSVNDVIHSKTIINYPVYSGRHDCDHRDAWSYASSPAHYWPGGADLEFVPVQNVLSSAVFQGKAELLARRYHDNIYRLNPEQLPDMSVFIAELKELDGIFSLIYEIAQKIIACLRSVRSLKKKTKLILRNSKYGKKARTVAIKQLRKGIAEYESKILGYRFGIMAPIRDLTKLVAAMYGYVDTFNFQRAPLHFREQFILESHHYGPTYPTGCWGETCPSGQGTGQVGKCDVSGYLSITSVVTNKLTGSNIEKLIAVLLGQLGMMPSLGSMWELVHLSWLIDYFYSTSTFIRKAERALQLGPNIPVVEDTTIGLYIEQQSTVYSQCWRRAGGRSFGPAAEGTFQYYERITAKERDLDALIKKWHLPIRGMELSNTVAFLTSLLL